MDQKIFEGEIEYQWTPQEATLGASASLLKAVIVHFATMPTTSENLVVSLTSENSDYDKVLYQEDPSAEGTQDLIAQWDEGFVLDKGDKIKITYPNTDAVTIEVTIKSRHF